LIIRYRFAKILLYVLIKTKLSKWPFLSRSTLRREIEYFFNFLFNIFGYYQYLLNDIESYMKVGEIRSEWVKSSKLWVDQKNKAQKNDLRIGFISSFGEEALIPKEFFYEHPENTEIYMYDVIRPNIRNRKIPYNGTKIFDRDKIKYKKIYFEDTYLKQNHSNIINTINKDNLDVIFFTIHTYSLQLLDMIDVPVILALNMTSVPTPHPKCKVQSYSQPSWPYEVKNNRLFNLVGKKYINNLRINHEALIYSKRIFVKTKPLDSSERKKQIIFSGNLKKLISIRFVETLNEIMKIVPEIIFLYYGPEYSIKHDSFESMFKDKEIKSRLRYGGDFEHIYCENGTLVKDPRSEIFKNELSQSMLFLNTFPNNGARSCIESYIMEVPVIHLDFKKEYWLKNKRLCPIRLPLIYTKSGTANSIQKYTEKAVHVINNSEFASKIINEQNLLLDKLLNHQTYWNELFRMIELSGKA